MRSEIFAGNDNIVDLLTIRAGKHLNYSDLPLDALWIVRDGLIKRYVVRRNGDQQILGFSPPGEIIGLDAWMIGAHQSSAVALTDSQVCRLPLSVLRMGFAGSEQLRACTLRAMGREVQRLQTLLHLDRCSADRRLGIFLLAHTRYAVHAQREGCGDIYLHMTREEIGTYLNLAKETISRVLARLQRLGFIKVRRSHIQLLNTEALQSYVNRTDDIGDELEVGGHSEIAQVRVG